MFPRHHSFACLRLLVGISALRGKLPEFLTSATLSTVPEFTLQQVALAIQDADFVSNCGIVQDKISAFTRTVLSGMSRGFPDVRTVVICPLFIRFWSQTSRSTAFVFALI